MNREEARVLLFVGGVAAGLGLLLLPLLWWQAGNLREVAHLRAAGRETAAVVVAHDQVDSPGPSGPTQSLRITCRFTAGDHAYDHEATVGDGVWDTHPAGSTVPVLYLADDPAVAMLRDGEVRADPGWAVYGTAAIVGLLLVSGVPLLLGGAVRWVRPRR